MILDTGDFFDISTDLVLKYGLAKNVNLEDERKKEIDKEQRIIDAKQTAYNYASYKPRTITQIKEKLKLKEFSQSETELALKFLKDFNLIDDEKFAKDFINSFLKKKPSGKQRLSQELYQKGVPKDIIESSIEKHFPEEDKYELAIKACEKKLRTISNKTSDKQKTSLISYLQRQGFDWQVIKAMTNHFFIEK